MILINRACSIEINFDKTNLKKTISLSLTRIIKPDLIRQKLFLIFFILGKRIWKKIELYLHKLEV